LSGAKKVAIVVERPSLKGVRRFYVVEVLLGLLTTIKHALKSVTRPWTLPVVYYPEQKKALPAATRGRHRLMKREDGSPRCTACMLCATNCPADCIHILAGESKDPSVEKFPVRFDIDALRCVFCGYCVEACPLDAIRMDVPEVAVAAYTRSSFVYTKEFLLNHDNRDFVEGYNPPRPVAWTHGPYAKP
jgi:NADH-quinone oxidoreductase subunit I